MNAPDTTNTLDPNSTTRHATLSQQLSAFAHGLTYDGIPIEVRERAKHLILDAVGVALASTTYEFAQRVRDGIQGMAEDGTCSVIGMPDQLPLRDAVLMNGVLVHGLDYDDSHLRAVLHPTVTAFITALGVSEKLNLSGRDLLTGYVLGVEMVTRIAAAAKGGFHHFGFHPTGLVGHFSCAITAGKLYGLTAQQITMAQGLAGSTAAATQEFLEEGAWNKRLHPGWASVAGITAANLARGGAIGPTKPYEGRLGIFNTHLKELAKAVDYAEITHALGKKWEVMEVAVKPFPVCHFIHACGDAALILREKHSIQPDDIETITALVAEETLHIIAEPAALKKKPANDYDAKFSVHYFVAACLARGKFGLAELEAEVRGDAAILALAQQVEAVRDADSLYPDFLSGGVIIKMKDGRQYHHHERINRGAGDRALSGADIEAKYFDHARLALPENRVREIRDAVLNLDKHGARELARTLTAHE
jgi:2-methylcitrate dehydratase PrpD